MREKQKGCLITSDLSGKKTFFDAKFILSHSLLISQKPVQRSGIGEKSSFSLLTGRHQRVKESYQFVSNWPFPHKKVQFAHFSTKKKQVCNVKKKHFQCFVNVNVNFLIYMIEISVEYTNSKSKMAVTVTSYMTSSYLD